MAAGETRAGKPAAGRKSLRERVGALRNLPPFLKQIWETSPGMTLASLSLRLVRALLPVVTLYVGKLIIDEALRLVALDTGLETIREWWDSGLLSPLFGLLWLELGLAVASDVLGRLVGLIDSLLSEKFTNATSVRLMQHAATLDLEDFEDSEQQDKLERARRQASGRLSLMSQLFGQAQDLITIVSFAAG
ncbi:MAG: ABC transporter ATP-binding protein, partial [Gammaproteobacteria bacterium]|nr:ABC transporter ATP-binding protein [Gammaproteobacteria bacterium]